MNFYEKCIKILYTIILLQMIMHSYFSVAPMMGKTDEYFCYLIKLINNNISVYTEMMHAEAINRTSLLDKYDFLKDKSNIAIQIAGNNPKTLANAAVLVKKKGFNEVNINCGCPSPKVISGNFGISLLLKPNLVKDCINRIQDSFDKTISIKTRIGIEDHLDNEKLLNNFLEIQMKVGINKFIIHARNAIIAKISAKNNLLIPKLNYNRVIKLKEKYKDNIIILNGGFKNTDTDHSLFEKVDGIMIGREAYSNPWIFLKGDSNRLLDKKLYLINKYLIFLKKQFQINGFNRNALYHIQKTFNGLSGAKSWRQAIDKAIQEKKLGCLFDNLEYNYKDENKFKAYY